MSDPPPAHEGFVSFRGRRTWYRDGCRVSSEVADGSRAAGRTPYPKIELHVHLEATVRPARLLEIARRNDVKLPAKDEAGLVDFCRFTDFDHFVQVWIRTTKALRHERDFRRIVVDYAGEAAARGCVYAEALFSPAEPMVRGTPWQEIFEGYCAGAAEAREAHGIEIRFTPDITRDLPVEIAEHEVEWAVKYRDRGVVGISLGGSEHKYPPELFARPFATAREGGLMAAPHAGELAGPASVRGALDVLRADRLRHGVRSVEDPALLAEIAERGIVCDVTPISNVRTGVVAALEDHPLPQMLASGVRCSISTDDPVLMDTDLDRDCAAAVRLGHTPRGMFEDAASGVFCDDAMRSRLRAICEGFDWAGASPGSWDDPRRPRA